MTETMQKLVEAIENRLYGTGISIEPQEITKNNGTKLMAITVGNGGDMIHKVVYVGEILNMMDAGEIDEEEAAEEFEEAYRQTGAEKRPNCADELADILVSGDVEKIMQHVRPILVNAEWNKEREAQFVNKNFLDLMIQYEVRVGEASAVIKKDMLTKWGISQEELENRAAENAKETGYEILAMSQIAGEAAGVQIGEDELPMCVVTNHERVKGASAMLFGELFEKLTGKMGSDFYVIPSSIHEVIIAPMWCGGECMANMITEVNETEVSEIERLSNHPYIYRRGSMQVAIA